MHDSVNLEAEGVPTVFVASSEFVTAAESQARALGADPARVFVEHPIQDRTDEAVRAIADRAFDALIGELVEKPSE